MGSPKLQQYDWNIQAQNSVKKSIPEKESTLSKMLNKMNNQDIDQAIREHGREIFSKELRAQGEILMDSNYLSSIVKMHPGTADTYFYELGRIVEY